MTRTAKPHIRGRQFKIRTVMLIVIIVAIDAAAYSQFVWHGSRLGLAVFLILTILLPLGLLIWWVATKIDWSGNTLY